MSLFEALILGLIQGLTEFIPVSSSGHLLLAHELFGSSDSSLAFDVALHGGTLLALIVYFKADIIRLSRNVHASNADGRLARLLIIATAPAAIAGILFAGFIDNNLRSPAIVAVMLAGVAVLMLIADRLPTPKDQTEIQKGQGIAVGVMQMLALVPGVSRSGITITAGLFAGLTRQQAARFSFLLAIPIIAGSIAGLFITDSVSLDVDAAQIIAGVLAAFVSGLLAIKLLLGVIARTGLMPFALYRFGLAAAVMFFLV